MNINRNNYEEFFLLYVDNELSAAERNAVDVFIGENPDLLEELLLLQQSTITPGHIVFENKDALLKNGEFALLQEKLMLYMDDELGTSEKQDVQLMITADKEAGREFNVLQQTKLEPVAVVFSDKRSLYRTEARVIGIKWWRIAAAVVLLLGIGVWSGITVYKNYFDRTAATSTIAKENDQPKQDKVNKNVVITDTGSKNNSIAEEKITPVIPQQDLAQQPVQRNVQPAAKNNQDIRNAAKENIVNNKPAEKSSNNLPKPYFENINNNKSNETVISNVPLKKENNSISISGNENAVVQTSPKERSNDPAVSDINSGVKDPKSTAALQAVYNPNDRFVEMDEDKAKHSKVGGLLRRVKRVLERTANIKTGDELKIAGFEIAIK